VKEPDAGLQLPPALIALGTESYLGTGALLWREGDPGGDVALVLQGNLEVYRESPTGELVLDVATPGSAVGEIALDGGTRTASVRAASACRLLRMGSGAFRQMLKERADILEALYWAQVNRFRHETARRPPAQPRALLDPLTRVYSYAFMDERLRAEVHRAHPTGETLSLVLVDVDALRAYNDTHGESAGDAVLVAVAGLLRRHVGRGDVVARYGGAHFAVLAYGATQPVAAALGEAIRAEIDAQPPDGICVSVGIATFPHDASDTEGLVRVADLNLYKAREQGGNQVVAGA
jgi:diguanylate cyclase (GGDEF)-like protein